MTTMPQHAEEKPRRSIGGAVDLVLDSVGRFFDFLFRCATPNPLDRAYFRDLRDEYKFFRGPGEQTAARRRSRQRRRTAA